jgi:hypothetical protein
MLMSFCVHLTYIYVNPCSRWQWRTMFELLWAILILSIYSLKHEGIIIDFILFLQHFKIFKLGKIDMIQVLGSLEDEQMFSNLKFIKSKIHNWLTNHLDLFVYMFGRSFFTMDKFLYDEATHIWKLSSSKCFELWSSTFCSY